MSRAERWLFIVLTLIAVGLWAAVAARFTTFWQSPLGPSMGLPTSAHLPLASETRVPPAAATNTLIPGQSTLTPIVLEQDLTPKCGGPAVMTILAIGSDTRSKGYLYGLADVIRLVRVDFGTPRITVLEFPRDLWVEIPELDPKHGITHGKINQSYLYGNPGMGYYSGAGEGPGLLARTLELNFGARPDHYIAANMNTFVHFVDALGGLDVYLPHNIDGRAPDQPDRMDLFFKYGPQHLNGKSALMLARIRKYSGYERTDQQNIILCGIKDALLNPYNLARTPEIIQSFEGAVQTDLSPEQLTQLACLAPLIESKNIIFAEFPPELLHATRTYDKGVEKEVFIYEADFQTLGLFVQSFQLGIWPTTNLAALTTPDPNNSNSTGFSCP